MKKILITGGSGLLGQYLNIETNSFFELLTLFKSNVGNCNRFNNVNADINNFSLIKEIFDSFKPDIVIHTAAITNPVPRPGQSSKEIYETNVNATKNIGNFANNLMQS